MRDLDAFLAFEHLVWAALVSGDGAADGRLLAPDFLGVYPTGYGDRGDHVDQLGDGPTVAEYQLDDARLVTISADAAIIVYRASYRRPGSVEFEEMYVSSLWCRGADGWVNRFSQDTPRGGPVV